MGHFNRSAAGLEAAERMRAAMVAALEARQLVALTVEVEDGWRTVAGRVEWVGGYSGGGIAGTRVALCLYGTTRVEVYPFASVVSIVPVSR